MPDNWRSVELKHLRALRAIAATGTFWAAADQLSAAQSTLSDHVAALEALTGQPLIERSRGRRTVKLTEAGRLLLGHADAIEARLLAAEADLKAFAAGTARTMHVGIYQSVANKVLPEVMRRFGRRWPDADVQLDEAEHEDELVERVEQGELDVSFSVQPIPDGPFTVRELMRDPYVLVVPKTSPMVGARPAVEDLAGMPMVGFNSSRTADLVESYVRGRGISPRVVFRSGDNGTVQAMVAAGIGVALAPLLAIDETDRKIAVVELADPIPPRVLVAVWHQDRRRLPPAIDFVEIASQVAAQVERAHDEFLARRAGSV